MKQEAPEGQLITVQTGTIGLRAGEQVRTMALGPIYQIIIPIGF